MKVPLRYQNTEYDCGTTTFINALAYLYDREEFPVSLLKAIYRFTLDVAGEDGVVGDDEVAIVLGSFTHNRLVRTDRLFSEERKDFSLMEKNYRTVILMNRGRRCGEQSD